MGFKCADPAALDKSGKPRYVRVQPPSIDVVQVTVHSVQTFSRGWLHIGFVSGRDLISNRSEHLYLDVRSRD